jgi:hypothetical protein
MGGTVAAARLGLIEERVVSPEVIQMPATVPGAAAGPEEPHAAVRALGQAAISAAWAIRRKHDHSLDQGTLVRGVLLRADAGTPSLNKVELAWHALQEAEMALEHFDALPSGGITSQTSRQRAENIYEPLEYLAARAALTLAGLQGLDNPEQFRT